MRRETEKVETGDNIVGRWIKKHTDYITSDFTKWVRDRFALLNVFLCALCVEDFKVWNGGARAPHKKPANLADCETCYDSPN
jgi:hypothetical protein